MRTGVTVIARGGSPAAISPRGLLRFARNDVGDVAGNDEMTGLKKALAGTLRLRSLLREMVG